MKHDKNAMIALLMRGEGKTLAAIGAAFGITKQGAARMVARGEALVVAQPWRDWTYGMPKGLAQRIAILNLTCTEDVARAVEDGIICVVRPKKTTLLLRRDTVAIGASTMANLRAWLDLQRIPQLVPAQHQHASAMPPCSQGGASCATTSTGNPPPATTLPD